jgi:hypothetical protein
MESKQRFSYAHAMPSTESSDPAAIFAMATSLWHECHKHAATNRSLNLSDAYSGIDSLMREVMRIATLFEKWSCLHVDFTQLTEPWPYYLQDHFGQECLSILLPERLADFNDHDCRRVAARLRLTFQ